MMEIDYERQLDSCYMRIHSAEKCDMTMNMISQNHINGFLPLYISQLNNDYVYAYKISSYQNLEDFYEKREMDHKDIMNFIMSINTVLDGIEEYLLDENKIILSPDKIFMDPGDGSMKFAYFTGKEESFDQSVRMLMEFVIRKVDHSDTAAVTMAYGIYKKSCYDVISPRELFEFEVISGSEMKEETGSDEKYGELVTRHTTNENVIPEIIENEEEIPDHGKIYTAYFIGGLLVLIVILGLAGIFFKGARLFGMERSACIGMTVIAVAGLFFGVRWFRENKTTFVKIVRTDTAVEYDEEKYFTRIPAQDDQKSGTKKSLAQTPPCEAGAQSIRSEKDIPGRAEKERPQEGMTVLLSAMDSSQHELRWEEKIGRNSYKLDDSVIVVGSSRDKSDCIINLPGISRMHARISRDGEHFYIKDLNSTNGTKVNDHELACFEVCEIKPNDRIYLGNVECIFV